MAVVGPAGRGVRAWQYQGMHPWAAHRLHAGQATQQRAHAMRQCVALVHAMTHTNNRPLPPPCLRLGLPAWRELTGPPYRARSTAGHVNHAIFWTNLCPPKDYTPPSGELLKLIEARWKSVDTLQTQFSAAAAGVQVRAGGQAGYVGAGRSAVPLLRPDLADMLMLGRRTWLAGWVRHDRMTAVARFQTPRGHCAGLRLGLAGLQQGHWRPGDRDHRQPGPTEHHGGCRGLQVLWVGDVAEQGAGA